MMRPFLTHEHPLRFAHRGSRLLWPENTMLAFQGAVDLDYRYIETDIHVTSDGVIILFHDDRLERLTNGAGQISDWRWEDLQRLDAAYRFDSTRDYPLRDTGIAIPTLEEAMTTFPDALFNIDLKQSGAEDGMAEFVRKHGFAERVLIASFRDRRIRRFRRLTAGEVATSAGPLEIAGAWLAARVGINRDSPADALQIPIGGRISLADSRLVSAAHAADKQVHVWTVNDPDEMKRLLDMGVDGIITDRPDLLNEVISKRTARE